MSKYSPVIRREKDQTTGTWFDAYKSTRNYKPIDLAHPYSAAKITLWEEEKTGVVVQDVEKFETFLKSVSHE